MIVVRVPSVRRSSLRVWVSAFRAVNAGVPILVYLAYRHATYALTRPARSIHGRLDLRPDADVDTATHPLSDVLEDPAALGTADARARRLAELGPIARWVTLYVELAERLADIEAEDAKAAALLEHLRTRLRELQAEIAAGRLDGTLGMSRHSAARLSGRVRAVVADAFVPALAQAWRWLLVLGFVLAEGVQFGLIAFDLVGVDVADLSHESTRNPVGFVSGIGFAFIMTVSVVILADRLFTRAGSLASASGHPTWRTLTIAELGGLTVFICATVYCLAAMRTDFTAAPNGARWGFILLSFLLPLAGGYVLNAAKLARSEAAQRRATNIRARAEDEMKADRLARHLAEEQRRRREIADLERKRSAFFWRKARIRRRLYRAERAIRATIERDVAIIRQIRHALGLDGYVFRVLAHRRRREDLLAAPTPRTIEPEHPRTDAPGAEGLVGTLSEPNRASPADGNGHGRVDT